MASQVERIFEWNGLFTWNGQILGSCKIGVPLKDVLVALQSSRFTIQDLLTIFKGEDYILWFDQRRNIFLIVLKDIANTQSQLKGWLHAMNLCRAIRDQASWHKDLLIILEESLERTSLLWQEMLPLLVEQGWDVEEGAMETKSGTRIHVDDTMKRS